MDELLLIVKDLMNVSKRLYKYSPLGSNVVLSVCETILSEISKANETSSKNDVADNTVTDKCTETKANSEKVSCKEQQKNEQTCDIKERVLTRQSTIISDDELKDAEQQVLEFIDKIKNELQF